MICSLLTSFKCCQILFVQSCQRFNLVAASFSLWQTARPIHLCTSTPSRQRCPTMSHPAPRMESLWARSRTTTTAVTSSRPRKSPKACRTRASSGRPTTQAHSHNRGESHSALHVETFLLHKWCWNHGCLSWQVRRQNQPVLFGPARRPAPLLAASGGKVYGQFIIFPLCSAVK